MRKGFRLALFVAAVAVVGVSGDVAHADCGRPANAVVAENCLPGTPPGEWNLDGGADRQVSVADVSVNRGETISFVVGTPATVSRIDIYRLGYYGGDGARKVATVPGSSSASWAVPADAVSGIYVARLVGEAGGGASRAVFVVRADGGSSDVLFQTSATSRHADLRAGHAMVRWLERNGYDVSYFTGRDADRRGGEILRHKVYLSVGDERWSERQRRNVEAARDTTPPVHLAFFGSAADADGGRPENALSGTVFAADSRPSALEVPEADGKMRFWRDTPNVSVLGPGEVWTGPEGTLGASWGTDLDNGVRPAGLVRLSTRVGATATHHAVFHRRPNGALVFSSGTARWSWGLEDVDMQQAMVNLLADMGVQPAKLQDGLVPAFASTDVVAPVSDVAFPTDGAAVPLLVPVTIRGTATDGAPGRVGGVEVSVDGGATWHPAEGREDWSYVWTPTRRGSYAILSRAVDDSGNLETPGAGLALSASRGGTQLGGRAPDGRDFITSAAGTFTDNVVTGEFGAGTPDANIAVTAVAPSDGDVQLGNVQGSAEFNEVGPDLPANWTSTTWTGGTATVGSGFLTVDGALANTQTGLTYGPGTTIEFVATFGAATFQNVGFGAGADGDIFNLTPPAAMFGTSSDGAQVLARVWTSGACCQDTAIGVATDGTPHTYRIVWRATGFDFYVDANLLHTQATAVAGPMRIAVSDYTFGDSIAVSVDYLHVLGYPATGTFISRVYNSGADTTSWKAMTWAASTPTGTTLAMSARISATSTPTGAWIPITGSGIVLGGTARYAQYRAVLSTTDGLVTPVLQSVSIAYDTTVGDTTPPTIPSRTPAVGATGVPVGTTVVVQFSEVMTAATITTSSFRLRAVGAGSDVAATVVVSGNVATLTPSAALTSGTYYSVTVAGTVADLSGNLLGTDAVWTFSTATPGFTDTTVADFQLALSSTCTVGSFETGGDVILTPTVGSGFEGTTLPSGWTATPWATGGTGTVSGGLLTVDGALVDTGSTLYAAGRAIEFVATFSGAYQNIGFGNSFADGESWAMFGSTDGINLYARTSDGGSDPPNTLISGSWLGSSHRFRIEWTTTPSVIYSIDGTTVATETTRLPATSLRPLISDSAVGGATLVVGGLRMSPFTSPCTLQSRVFDAGLAVSWSAPSRTADVPSGTTLTLTARSGNTATPDTSWTAFGSAAIGRYAQYQAALSRSNATRTPVLEDVTMSSTAAPTRTLTLTAPANGWISGTGIDCSSNVAGHTDCSAETYNHGTIVALTANPAPGYQLSTWSGACTGTTNPCNVTMDANKTVGATFTIQTFTLTVTPPSPLASGTITSTPAGINCGADCTEAYNSGTAVTLTATPAAGYDFTGWTGDCSPSTTNTCALTMNVAHTAGATFTIQRYTLTVTAPTNGYITSPAPASISCGTGGSGVCSATLDYGTAVPLTANAATGYGFSGWTVTGTGPSTCTGTTNPCSVTMNSARTIDATFSILRYTLTVTRPTHGEITGTGISCGTVGTDCTETFDYSTTPIPLTATPDLNYDFTGWTGGYCTGTTNPCNVTMTAARTVGASFTIQRFMLTVGRPTHGRITSSPAGIDCGTSTSTCTATYDWNTPVTLTAVPDANYNFGGWTGDCSGISTSCLVSMTQARAAGAIFTIQRFTLTTSVNAPPHGTITSSPAGINCGAGGSACAADFDWNTVVTLTETHDAGYNFTGWSGACSGTGACSVTMTAARTVNATFTIQRFTLTVTRPTRGTITGTGITCGTGGSDCSEIYDSGTVVPLTATADAGYQLGGWTGDCSGSGACSVTMTAPHTVGATFTIQRHTLTVTLPTGGTVTGSGISCGTGGGDCSETYDYGTGVTLTATPDATYNFGGWTGACTGSGACSFSMTEPRTVGATFLSKRNTLTVTPPTHGTITSNPAGISCGTGASDCTEDYDYGAVVGLTATGDTGYRLRMWTGACTGTGSCSVTMTAAATVGGIFGPSTAPPRGTAGTRPASPFLLNEVPAAPPEASPEPAPETPDASSRGTSTLPSPEGSAIAGADGSASREGLGTPLEASPASGLADVPSEACEASSSDEDPSEACDEARKKATEPSDERPQ